MTGPSGAGKTTLLMTLAGLLAPLRGGVTVDGRSIDEFAEDELRSRILFFAEDAHLFATTVRDNLLVARGDSTDTQILAALDRVGLGDWLAGLPNGLETVLDGGAEALGGAAPACAVGARHAGPGRGDTARRAHRESRRRRQ